MNEPSHIPRWNLMESKLSDWMQEHRPKPIGQYYDEIMKHVVVVYEARHEVGM